MDDVTELLFILTTNRSPITLHRKKSAEAPPIRYTCLEGEHIEVSIREKGATYSRLVFRKDRLIGAVFLGDIRSAGVYASLINSGTPLGRLREKAEQRRLNAADLLTIGYEARPAHHKQYLKGVSRNRIPAARCCRKGG